jgi:hypothetical protein
MGICACNAMRARAFYDSDCCRYHDAFWTPKILPSRACNRNWN